MERIVIACTGDGDPLMAASTEAVAAGAEVVGLVLDLGDGEPLEALRDAALAAGAVRAHVLDVRDEFARGYLLPALRAGALGEDGRVEAALRRAIAARMADEIAALERASATALRVIDRRADVPARAVSAAQAQVAIAFDGGAPISINGIAMPMRELIDTLATIAREHGIGAQRVLALLQAAHARLHEAALPPPLVPIVRELGVRYAELLVAGEWTSVAREALDAFFAKAQERVAGVVTIVLRHGGWQAIVRAAAEGPTIQ